MSSLRTAIGPSGGILTALAWSWVGLIVGVSFIATPAKFLAPSLDLPTALDVGRATFAIFVRVELVLAFFAMALCLLPPRRPWRLAIAILVVAIVAGQYLGLWPLLDERVQIVLNGGQPTPSSLHTLCIACEAVKLVALAALGLSCIKDRTAK